MTAQAQATTTQQSKKSDSKKKAEAKATEAKATETKTENKTTETDTKVDGSEGQEPETKAVGGQPPAPITTVEDDEYELLSDDVDGYWDHKTGDAFVRFRPRGARLMDGHSKDNDIEEMSKSSCLIIGELTSPTVLTSSGEDRKPKEFPAGSVVGIWGKHGMRDLKAVAGCRVQLSYAGEQKMKDDGETDKKGEAKKPMVKFKVHVHRQDTRGEQLELIEDTRNLSVIEPHKCAQRSNGKYTGPWWLELLPSGDKGMAAAKALAVEQARKTLAEAGVS